MMTGLHRIRAIKCKKCRQTIGWTYVSVPILNSSPNLSIFEQVFAYEESEKYKEGKFIIERFYIAKKTEQDGKNSMEDIQNNSDDDCADTINQNSNSADDETILPRLQQNVSSPWNSNIPDRAEEAPT